MGVYEIREMTSSIQMMRGLTAAITLEQIKRLREFLRCALGHDPDPDHP